MKINLLLLFVFLGVSLNISAQKTSRAHRGQSQFMVDKLELTAEQKEGIEVLNKGLIIKMDSLKADQSISRSDKQARRKEVRRQHYSSVNALFTTEQQAKVKELRAERKVDSKHDSKLKERRNHTPLDSLTTAQLSLLREDYLEQKKSIEMTRIAPDEQNRRLEELKSKFKKEKREIIRSKKQDA